MKSALEAMKSNEKVTNKRYEEAVAMDFPEDVMKLLRVNLAHEQQHLDYIIELLELPRRELYYHNLPNVLLPRSRRYLSRQENFSPQTYTSKPKYCISRPENVFPNPEMYFPI